MKKSLRYLALALLLCLSLPRLSKGADPTVGGNNPTGVTGDYNGSITTAGSYDPFTGNAKRMVDDLSVAGSVGAYPLKFTRILNTRGGSGVLGHGGGWRHSYQWGLSALFIYPPNPDPCFEPPPNITISYPDGGKRGLRFENGIFEQVDGGEPMGDRLVSRPDIGSHNYDLNLKDGGRVEFRNGGAGSFHPARAIVDPYGQRTTLEYDTLRRLWKITEPAGRFLQISYGPHCYWNTAPQPREVCVDFITQVAAHDGRGNMMEKVIYNYTLTGAVTALGVRFHDLTRVDYDDVQAPHANYVYDPPERTNPGDETTTVPGRVRTCDDVRYDGPMKRIMYEYLPATNNLACPVASGQILAEKNMTNGQDLSRVTYPVGGGVCTSSNLEFFKRTETRADTATREFEYDRDGELMSYTDFAYPGETHHTTIITFQNVGPDGWYQRIVEDALHHTTKTEKEPKIGAVMAEIHADGHRVKYDYTDMNDPRYLLSREDERHNITFYDRRGSTELLNPNRVWRIRYPDYPYNGWEEFTYNNFGQVLTHRMTSGGTEVYTYDGRGLKETYTPPATPSDENPALNPTRYFYHTSGPHIDRLWYEVDPRGNATWYEYNSRGLVTKVTHQDTKFIQNEYYPDGTLHWTEDELRHKTTYTRDEYKRVTAVTNHLNESVTNSYASSRVNNDLEGRSHTTASIYLTTSQMGRQTQYDYDANFRRTMTKQAPGDLDDEATTNFFYDWVGNLEWIEDRRHKLTKYGYDGRNRRTSVWNQELNETTWVQYDAANNKEKETRQDGAFRTWDYDAMNRLWHAYDWRISDPATPNQTTTYDNDHAGNVQSITDTKGAIYEYGYDWLNRKISATYPSAPPTLPQRMETWLYDKAGNLVRYKNPADQFRHFEYDDRNRQRRSYWHLLPDANAAPPNWGIGQEITTTPDAASRITEIKTNNGETIVGFGYDAANRKIWEDQTLIGQPARRVKTPVDPDGKRTDLQIVDPPAVGGRLVISPEMAGTGTYSVSYQYTKRNQLKTISGNSGENWAFHYAYDPSGNMISRRADYNYTSSSTNCPDAGANECYDALNRPRRWEQTGPNGFYKLSHYRYDNVNREEATWRAENSNRGERYEYEVTNQLKKVSYNINISTTTPPPSPTPPGATPTPPNATPTPPNATPTPPGATPTPPNATPTPPSASPTPPEQVAMPTFNPVDPNGYDYYPNNTIPITIATTTTGAHIRYTIDDDEPTPEYGTLISASSGIITGGYREDFTLRAIAFKPGMADSAVMEAGYNWGGGEAPTVASRVVTYVHTPDKLNRSSMNDSGTVTNYSPNALNQYTSTVANSFSYDNNFNLTHTAGFNGVYDAANRLVLASNGGSGEAQTTIVGFVYDGLGRCVKRTVGSAATVFIYDGWKPIGEWEESTPEYFHAWNVYGPGADEILLRQQGNIGYIRFQLDRHGNVAFLVDNDGVLKEKYTYDVFGHPKITDPSGNVRSFSHYHHAFHFQGREYIRQLGIYDYRHRFYHPKLGRFIQTDPIGLQTEGAKLSAQQAALYVGGGAPDAFSSSELNLYRFCNNDPVNGSDPFGLLDFRFDKDFPIKGPTGRDAIEGDIKKELNKSAKGREILAAEGVVKIHRVNAAHPRTGTDYSPDRRVKNFDTYLDPSDSRFQDKVTFRQLFKNKGELPPDNVTGRAIMLGHELAHGVFKMADEHDGGRNIRDNENAIRRELGVWERRTEGGVLIPR